MAMKVVWAAVLLAYGVSTGAAKPSSRPGLSTSSLLPLDMAPDSVDDMYDGCKDDMAKMVEKYLENERSKDKEFKEVWDAAVKWYDDKRFKPKLGREQVIAIHAYTSDLIHDEFNDAVQIQGSSYGNEFGFHAFHFYLTDAIKKLNDGKCHTVHRRSMKSFNQDVVNTPIRFGFFASTSKKHLLDLNDNFGKKSCFVIVTCMGADISMYSKYPSEGEVLIPPYEVFTVTEVTKKSEQPGLPCDVVYKLQSTEEPFSKLNCALFPK